MSGAGDMGHKIYTFNKIRVFFKHTDYYGYVHPYNYLEWMSYVREAYFQDLVPNFLELCQKDIKMVTMISEYRRTGDAIFGDRIYVEIHSENVRRISFDVIFSFFETNKQKRLGEGRQTLTFINAATGRPEKIPEELKEQVLLYEKRAEKNEQSTD
jgi:acyl-CoA thioesterase FadM